MANSVLIGEKQDVIEKIQKQIFAGEKLLTEITSNQQFKTEFEGWRDNTIKILNSCFEDKVVSSNFSLKTHKSYSFSSFSDLQAHFEDSIKVLRAVTEDINSGLHDVQEISQGDVINYDTAIIIIRRVLNNFHKHLKSMYKDKPHGKAGIKEEHLEKITIRNEYDVQRILYALIKPIFPLARLEVPQDTGNHTVRTDIYLDEYKVIIEVKCSRPNMKERDLTEELGSDAFHYEADHLFLFVYDKDSIISNEDSFTKSYRKDKATFGKEVEAIVAQPVVPL